MVSAMQRSAQTDAPTEPALVREHFRGHAQAFDDLYEDERPLVRLLRPGLFRRRRLAVETVAARQAPRVLDVGCGSGRIGELVLAAGAGDYVGIDFAEPMLDLARTRLQPFGERATLVVGDFMDEPLQGPFDVILALGLFDYIRDAHLMVRRMFALCGQGGCIVGSFPSWSLIKGPIRKVRYEWINRCPIFNYTQRELELMFGAAGFERVEVKRPGRSGHLVRAWRTDAATDGALMPRP